MGTSIPMLQWRQFEFFNIQEGADNGVLDTLVKGGSTLSCACSGRGQVYTGDTAGYVHCLNRTLHSPVPSFPAHDAPVAWIWASDTAPVLVTLAHPANSCSELKVWCPDRLQADQPTLLRLLRPDSRPQPSRGAPTQPPPRVAAVVVHPNLNMLALGFSSGAVMIYRGDLVKERDRGSTSRVIVTLSSGITNLHFHLTTQIYSAHTPSHTKSGVIPMVNVPVTTLVVTTATNVYNIACTNRDKETTEEVDSVGCRSGCSALAEGRSDHMLVMARDDALYTYSSEGRAGIYAFPGIKQRLFCHRGYALVVAVEKTVPAVAGGGARPPPKSVCTLYDLSNKLVALTCTLPSPPVGVVAEWGSLYGVHGVPTPSLLHYKEKDLHTKMEILFKKNQYDIAVSLAKGQSVSSEGVAEILKQYGDWLYSKGDLEMAVHQYIKTIPYLEPSYVIKKFLNSEHMTLLADYLEALHAMNLHTADHSSLLLNCYTRHKHDDRIQAFIEKHSEQVMQSRKLRSDDETIGSSFSAADVELLVSVCREGGFHREALQLSSLHQLHSLHLEVLCNDTKQHRKAVEYIRSLPLAAASEQMVAHGSVLARGCPDETLELLIELATDYTPDNTPLVGEAALDGYLSSSEPECAAPELFESVVCGDSLLAIRYIEGVTKRHSQLGGRPTTPRMYEMLLAEYLQQYNDAEPGVVKDTWEHKLQGIISDPQLLVDPSLACLLCDRHNYSRGKLVIWRHHDMYGEILQYHMGSNNEAAMVAVCEENHAGQPELWLSALRLITAPQLDRAPDTTALQTILQRVDALDLLPPMEVLDLVCACPLITLGQVRGYLISQAEREEQSTAEHKAAVDEFVGKTSVLREQIDDIHNNGVVFTESKCDACQKDLEFPTVHFLCKHSFHHHCFASYCSTSEEECPVCLPRHNQLREALRQQASARASFISFGNPKSPDGGGDLDSSSGAGGATDYDVISELSEYLAKGLFTDYSATVAAQAVRHIPAAKGFADDDAEKRNQKAAELHESSQDEGSRRQRAAAAALEPSQVAQVPVESRVRQKESRAAAPLLASDTEGRLRQARGASPHAITTESEGRLRGHERTGNTVPLTSEGRLRHQQESHMLDTPTEGRVRASVPSSVAAPQPEARIRTQSKKFGGQGFGLNRSPYDKPTNLQDQITTQPGPVDAVAKKPENRSKHADAMESISASLANSRAKEKPVLANNPFAGESSNPFGEDFVTEQDQAFNEDEKKFIKEEGKEELNPFGTQDDYDNNLNPFEE